MQSLLPEIWRLIAAASVDGALRLPSAGDGRFAQTEDNRKVGWIKDPPLTGPFEELHLSDWDRSCPRPWFHVGTSWETFRDLRREKETAVHQLVTLMLVCRDVKAALDPVWPDIYRSVVPVYCFFDRRIRRVQRDMRPDKFYAPLPAAWFRLRVGLLFQNPTKLQRKAARKDKARAQLVIGYSSRPRAKLKAHYARVRKDLRKMEITAGQS